MAITKTEIVLLLRNDANRRAKNGDKRGARIIRNSIALILTDRTPDAPAALPSIADEFVATT